MDKEKVIKNVIKSCHEFYDREHPQLVSLALKAETEGEIRHAAGDFIERFLQNIFDTINREINSKIDSKVGTTDFLSLSIEYKGKKISNNKIQVDRHVFNGNKRICFIENKTYLDSCYYDRALADFKKIVYSMKQQGYKPEDYKYIVFAGQNAASDSKLFFYEAEFHNSIKHLTQNQKGVDTRIFFFLKSKRNSSHPMYKEKHELNDDTIKKFVLLVFKMLNY